MYGHFASSAVDRGKLRPICREYQIPRMGSNAWKKDVAGLWMPGDVEIHSGDLAVLGLFVVFGFLFLLVVLFLVVVFIFVVGRIG